jgi:hypothetical protein
MKSNNTREEMMSKENGIKKKLTPLRAIRLKCLDCSCYQRKEIELCQIKDCPLYQYRFGKNPNRAGIGPKNSPILEKTHS